jgi:hypothetical protein
MIGKEFFKAGHTLTLFAAFFYFDMAFMAWVILGPLGVQIAKLEEAVAADRAALEESTLERSARLGDDAEQSYEMLAVLDERRKT